MATNQRRHFGCYCYRASRNKLSQHPLPFLQGLQAQRRERPPDKCSDLRDVASWQGDRFFDRAARHGRRGSRGYSNGARCQPPSGPPTKRARTTIRPADAKYAKSCLRKVAHATAPVPDPRLTSAVHNTLNAPSTKGLLAEPRL